MARAILIVLTILVLIFFSLWQRAASGQPTPSMENLLTPPEIIKYKREAHAVFDFGGLQMLHKVTKKQIPYPQCDVMQRRGQEIMVVGHNPRGYVFFVQGEPIAFRTKHNQAWQRVIDKSFRKSRQ